MSFLTNLKLFVVSFTLLLSVSFLTVENVLTHPVDYTYEKVLIGNVWWVFVYDGDILVNSYPDDDID